MANYLGPTVHLPARATAVDAPPGGLVETTILGRTGLNAGVAGLGCGGHSRLGRTAGASQADSVRLVEHALALGITYLDTAESYGTEEIVGKAIAGRRDQVVVSTKTHPTTPDGRPLDGPGLRAALERSLVRLRCDHVDVYHLHGVPAKSYDHCAELLVPELQRLRSEGLIRFVALSERFNSDPSHAMLERAVRDDVWDVVMVGFNLFNPSARRTVLPEAVERGTGVEVMYAVRRALSDREECRRIVRTLVDEGRVPRDEIDFDDPLGFLTADGAAESVVDAAYRFCRHEPGCGVILTGTGSREHLEQNLRSLARGPLPTVVLERLRALFGELDHLSGN